MSTLAATAAQQLTDGTLPAPGWIGFGLLVLMTVALVLLLRSMNRHLRNVPRDPVGPVIPPLPSGAVSTGSTVVVAPLGDGETPPPSVSE